MAQAIDLTALALRVLAEVAGDTTAPALARVQAAGLLLAHHGTGADDSTPVRFVFSLADHREKPDLEQQ